MKELERDSKAIRQSEIVRQMSQQKTTQKLQTVVYRLNQLIIIVVVISYTFALQKLTNLIKILRNNLCCIYYKPGTFLARHIGNISAFLT